MRQQTISYIALNVLNEALSFDIQDPVDFMIFMSRVYEVFFKRLMAGGKTTADCAQARSIKFKSVIQTINFFLENSKAIDTIEETKRFYKAHAVAIFEKVEWSTEYDLVVDYFETEVA